MVEELVSQAFWVGLMKIIGVNIVLSGDNAVVIALAARSLQPHQQKAAIMWGSGAAIVMRIVLTIFAVALLGLPWLKLIGSLLLFWIGVQLLAPDDGDPDIKASDNLVAAIKTILIADLVMSLDNVIAVAAAANNSMTLLILGLGISIPLVIFGATMLLKLMERFPIIITIGGALIGMVAGEMLVSDQVLIGEGTRSFDALLAGTFSLRDLLVNAGVTFDAAGKPRVFGGLSLESICGGLGALGTILMGKWLTARQASREDEAEHSATH